MTPRRLVDLLLLAACALTLSAGVPRAASALGADADTTAVQEEQHGFLDRLASRKLQAFGFVYLPKVSYGEFTGIGFGGHILRPFHWHDGATAFEIDIEGRATTKGQGEAAAELSLEWGHERYYLKTDVEFTNLAHRFYGLGPDTPDGAEEVFERQSLRNYAEFLRRVTNHLRVGVRGEAETSRMLVAEREGLFNTTDVPGTEHSQVTGLGGAIDWDSRDDRYWTTRGGYYQTYYLKFDDATGSDYNFDLYYVDLRHFIPTGKNHVLALQTFLFATDGAPPFWRLAELGGRNHSRGYRRARYRDKVLLAFQGEHRFAVWRRLALVGFAGLADVASTIDRLQFEHMRLTVGGGVRLRVGGGDHRINARLDVAYGNEVRLYFRLGEAF